MLPYNSHKCHHGGTSAIHQAMHFMTSSLHLPQMQSNITPLARIEIYPDPKYTTTWTYLQHNCLDQLHQSLIVKVYYTHTSDDRD